MVDSFWIHRGSFCAKPLVAAFLFASSAWALPPGWMLDSFGLRRPDTQPQTCADQLLDNAVSAVMLASHVGRPVYRQVAALAEKNWTIYREVTPDALSRRQAQAQYQEFEAQTAEEIRLLGPAANDELFSIFADPSQVLSARRAALRLLLLNPGAEAKFPLLFEHGDRLAFAVLYGTSSHAERTLAGDLVGELGKLSQNHPFVRDFFASLLQKVLTPLAAQSPHQRIYADELRTAILLATLRNADRAEFLRLAGHLESLGIDRQVELIQITVAIANALDSLLDDVANQTLFTTQLLSVFRPTILKAIEVFQKQWGIGIQSTDFPSALAWNEDLGTLIGFLHLTGALDTNDYRHPARFFVTLVERGKEALFTPSQRYLIRNFSQSVIVGRVSEDNLAVARVAMETALKKLNAAAIALPQFDSNLETKAPSEYSDIHFLLIIMPWSQFTYFERQALVSVFLDAKKYGSGIASTAAKILQGPSDD